MNPYFQAKPRQHLIEQLHYLHWHCLYLLHLLLLPRAQEAREILPQEMANRILKLFTERSILQINKDPLLIASNTQHKFNFTPVPVERFIVGLPSGGKLREAFSSDDGLFGGGGRHSTGDISALREEFAGHSFRAVIDLPPLSAVYFDYFEKEEGMTL